MQKASVARIALASVVACSFLLFVAQTAYACPDGTQPATASDLANMTAAGISNPIVGMCWNPSSTQAGIAVAQAKQYLQSAKCSGATIDTQNLNAGFAQCAQKFVQSARSQDPNFCLTSAYRSVAQQQEIIASHALAAGCPTTSWCSKLSGTVAPAGNSYHQFGLAIDVSSKVLSYQAIWNLADSQGIENPVSLHKSDPLHVQAKAGMQCNSGGNTPAPAAQSPITPLQGLGQLLGFSTQQCQAGYTMVNGQCTLSSLSGTPQPGQVVSQDTICVISTNPIVTQTIPAGSVYPYGCLNSSQTTNSTQLYCSGNSIVSNSSGYPITIQTCQYGCSNGVCMQQQAQQQSSTASNQGTSGTAATNQTTGTSGTTNSSTVTSPTLVSTLLSTSSTASILDALANPQHATTSATTTPIILNPAVANNIAQLQANAPAGVTYAMPTSAYFPSSGSGQQSGSTSTQTPNANGGSDTGISVTTTQGTGYDIPGDTTTQATNTSGPIATNVVAQSGVETFTPTYTDANANTQGSYYAASTFNNGALSALAILKAEVLSAINFLAVYVQPFGGNVPSQMVGD